MWRDSFVGGDELNGSMGTDGRLGFFYTQMEKAGIPLRKIDLDVDTLAAPSASEIDELADRSQSLEQRVASLNDSYETLKKREVELTEWRWVLREAGGFFDRAHGNTEAIRASNDDDDAPLLQDVEQPAQNGDAERSFSVMNIGFVAAINQAILPPMQICGGCYPQRQSGCFRAHLMENVERKSLHESIRDPRTSRRSHEQRIHQQERLRYLRTWKGAHC